MVEQQLAAVVLDGLMGARHQRAVMAGLRLGTRARRQVHRRVSVECEVLGAPALDLQALGLALAAGALGGLLTVFGRAAHAA